MNCSNERMMLKDCLFQPASRVSQFLGLRLHQRETLCIWRTSRLHHRQFTSLNFTIKSLFIWN